MKGGRSRVLRISHAPLCYCACRRVEIASELPSDSAPEWSTASTTPDGQIFFASLVGTISLARMNRHNPTSKACVTTSAAALPAEHHAAMASALAMSDSEAVREAALGFAFSPDPTVSAAALIAVSQQGHGPLVSSKVVDATFLVYQSI